MRARHTLARRSFYRQDVSSVSRKTNNAPRRARHINNCERAQMRIFIKIRPKWRRRARFMPTSGSASWALSDKPPARRLVGLSACPPVRLVDWLAREGKELIFETSFELISEPLDRRLTGSAIDHRIPRIRFE